MIDKYEESMTLDDAIKHLDEIIPTIKCDGCRNEHIQLKKWLQELKAFRGERTTPSKKFYSKPDRSRLIENNKKHIKIGAKIFTIKHNSEYPMQECIVDYLTEDRVFTYAISYKGEKIPIILTFEDFSMFK